MAARGASASWTLQARVLAWWCPGFYLGLTLLAWMAPLSNGQAVSCSTFSGRSNGGSTLEGWDDFNSASATACCDSCLANPHCGSFMWTPNKRCSLMAPADPSLYEDSDINVISGVKTGAIVTTPAAVEYSEFVPGGPMHLRDSALYAYSAIALTHDTSQTGLAMLLNPVQLLRDADSRCQAASFTAAFSFQTYHSPVQPPADGFTFFVAASDIPLETLGRVDDSRYQGFSSSYEDALRRPGALAIEYDTFKDAANADPDDSHVGLNLNYNPRSVKTASTLPSKIRLHDYRTKHTWIDYDAATTTLRVFLSYGATKPATALLSHTLDLCRTLRQPQCSSCASTTTAYLGFSGATHDYDQTTTIFSWTFKSAWPANSPGTLPPASKCTSMTGCQFEGFDLEAFGSLVSPSPADCCSKCAAQPRCLAFNWRASKRCDLKAAGDAILQGDPALASSSCGERLAALITTPASAALPRFNASSPLFFLGSARLVSSSLKLTYEGGQVGLALHQHPVQLLRDVDSECEAASFSAAFSFHLREPSPDGWGDGLTFMALAANLRFGQLAGWDVPSASMGFHLDTDGPRPGSLAVEFDLDRNDELGELELEAGHVGIDTGYSPESLAAVATRGLGVNLLDSRIKFAWVDYDAEDQMLAVFLSYSATKPKAPILSHEIDMCQVLRPPECLQQCASITTAYWGFSSSTLSNYHHSEILSFQFRSFWPSAERDTGGFSLGVVPLATTPQRLNQHFRYASMGYLAQTGAVRRPPSWLVAIRWNWTEDAVAPIRDQKDCSACYAFAAASSIESAFFLTYFSKSASWAVPDVAEQQLIDCVGGEKCKGGWPGDALDYAARSVVVPEKTYPFKSANGTCSVPLNPAVKYQLASFEAVSFLGWLGLLLAVQQTPVVVNIEGSKASFIGYTGGIYDDGNCYSRGVDHSVVIVGYDLLSSPPFWIIRNSWGTQWGERGYMRMAIRPGDGICGINTMPGYIPIFKAKDACNTNSYPKQTGLFNVDAAPGRLNPCGGGKCTNLAGGKNKCACPKNFVAAPNSDGTETCVPVSPCTFLQGNPCRVGTCLDSQTKPGTYSCICPLGYEEGTVALDNSVTCVPAAQVGGLQYYTVPTTVAVTCIRVYEVYGIAKNVFLAQNGGLLDCSKPLPAGTRVNVTNALLRGCALPYAVNAGDTCTSIAKLFKIAALSGTSSPNPNLNCTALQPGQQVCIRRRAATDTSPPDVPLCTAPYVVSNSETCTSLISSRFSGDAASFFTLNPGLYCNNFNRFNVANVTIGQQVCTGATNLEAIQRGCRGKLISIQSGDTCLSLIAKHYCRRRRVFRQYNRNWNCDNSRLLSSRGSNPRLRLCAPREC